MYGLLIRALAWFGRLIVLRWLLTAGGVIVSSAASLAIINGLKAMVMEQLNGVGGVFVEVLSVTGIAEAVTIIFSAYVMAAGIKALRGVTPGGGSSGGGQPS